MATRVLWSFVFARGLSSCRSTSAVPPEQLEIDICGAPGAPACSGATGSALGLLQFDAASRQAGRTLRVAATPADPPVAVPGHRDLVLQHVPFNFGHTIEKVATFGNGKGAMLAYGATETTMMSPRLNTEVRWEIVNNSKADGGQVWGHLNPDLFAKSEITGCPLYFTPGKFWPKEVAETYFGSKVIFGMLRDPYERLVSMFRGNFRNYGGADPKYFKTCDVNGAVRQMVTDYLAGNTYASDCTFVPQAEYFDPPFGITVPVDNRLFPDSANDLFRQHGYPDLQVHTEDILHVTGCPEVWAGDLDCDTKALVKQVYARDFELLCKHFGYCGTEDNTCITKVPKMCPSDVAEKNKTATQCR